MAGVTCRFGYKAAGEQFGPRQLVDLGVLAEQAGFDSVWVSDGFHPWRHADGHGVFALSWLAALGERTSRIQIGPCVLTPTLRHRPVLVAQAFGTLGSLYPGRVALGLGTGEPMNEVPPLAIRWPAYAERAARLEEAIDLIRALWERDRVTYEGRWYRTADATIYDRPPLPVPLYVAASGPRTARLAGRVADGFVCTSGAGLERCRELLAAVDEGAREAGRDPASIARMIEMKVSFDFDHARALRDTHTWAPLALRARSTTGREDPRELERAAPAVARDTERRWIVSSDPDEHAERLLAFVQAGVDELVFHAPGQDQARFITLYAEHVLPRLRALAAV